MTILATDDWSAQGDNADIGAAWDANTSDPAFFNILSGAAVAPDPGFDSSESNNAASWPNDQYAEAKLNATHADGVGIGHGVLLRANTSGTRSYYRLVGNASGYEFAKMISGSFTSLASGSGTTFAGADKIYASMVGQQPTLKKNGVSFGSPPTDSAHSAGKACVAFSSAAAIPSDGITSWEGGDFVPPIPTQRSRSAFRPELDEDEGRFNELDVRNWWREGLMA